jgi:hypothetical protein
MKFVVVLIGGLIVLWTINLVRAVATGKAVETCPHCGLPWFDCYCRPQWLAKKHWLGRLLKINKEIT